VCAVVIEKDCDINIFVESWLNSDVLNDAININGYNIIRQDRLDSKGGGIIFYVKDSILNYSVVEHSIPYSESLIIKFPKLKILIICLYHPFWNNVAKHTETADGLIHFLSQFSINNHNYNFVLCGDFNGLSDYLDPICDIFNFTDIVNFATRKNKILDHFITNINTLTAKKASPIGKSDHCSIIISCLSDKIQRSVEVIKRPDFSPKNRLLFAHIIKNLKQNYSSNCINKDWSNFVTNLHHIFNFCFPCRSIRVYNNPRCPWITNNIRMLIRKRDIAYRHNLKPAYKHWKFKVKHAISVAKENYFKHITEIQSRTQWKKVKHYINFNKPKQLISISDEEINKYFASVYISDNNIPSLPINVNPDKKIHVDESEILKLLKGIKKSGGYPAIHSSCLTLFPNYISKPLTDLINRSISLSIFPDIFKNNTIIPVPKVSNPSSSTDYRPITATSPLSKILEKVVQTHWLEPLILENEHLFNDQYAFIPLRGRGCQSALTFMYTKLVQLIDNKFFVCSIFIDLSKAFDRATVSKIVSSLTSLNAPSNVIRWVSSFLSGRKHKVGNSQFLNATSGTPQGSPISPILFAILLSSLSPVNSDNCCFIKYADDLTIIVWDKDPSNLQTLCQVELNNIIKWCNNNQMQINVSKSKALFHQSRNLLPTPNLYIQNEQLLFSNDAKVLGMFLSANLKWNKHVDYSISRASKKIFHLCLLRRACSRRIVLLKIYEYFIRNILTYSFPAMSNMPNYLFKKYIQFEKRCSYIMGFSPPTSFIKIVYGMCKKLKENILLVPNHPFRRLLLKKTHHTKRTELAAPGGTTSLYTDSFISMFN